jgi:putative membrane protein
MKVLSETRRDRFFLFGIGLASFLVLLIIGFLLLGREPLPKGNRDTSILPSINALLNGTSAFLLTVGFWFIRHRRVTAHKACMLTAFGTSSLFLISYLIYHHAVGSVPFPGRGWIRAVYFPVLISHISLAALAIPLALTAIYRALRGQFEQHRRIARWTFRIWLYSSISGVVVYWMVYHLYPT